MYKRMHSLSLGRLMSLIPPQVVNVNVSRVFINNLIKSKIKTREKKGYYCIVLFWAPHSYL